MNWINKKISIEGSKDPSLNGIWTINKLIVREGVSFEEAQRIYTLTDDDHGAAITEKMLEDSILHGVIHQEVSVLLV